MGGRRPEGRHESPGRLRPPPDLSRTYRLALSASFCARSRSPSTSEDLMVLAETRPPAARCTPGRPASTTKDARVEIGAPARDT